MLDKEVLSEKDAYGSKVRILQPPTNKKPESKFRRNTAQSCGAALDPPGPPFNPSQVVACAACLNSPLSFTRSARDVCFNAFS